MITLTKTMLDKSTIDCNAPCRAVALKFGVDFENMGSGDKTVIPAVWVATGEDTEVRFYRTKGPRADRRISIKDIRKNADVGDIITLIKSGKTLLIEVAN